MRRAVVVAIIIGIFSLTIIVQMSLSRYTASTTERIITQFPNGKYLKMASLGFDVVVADLIWVYTTVSFGEDMRWAREVDWLHRPLTLITDLDPYFAQAYLYGGLLLSTQIQDADRSIALVEKGIKYISDEWRLYFVQGFNYAYHKNDSATAARYFEKARELPGPPPYIVRLIGNLYAQAAMEDSIDPLTKIDLAIQFLKEAESIFKGNPTMANEIALKINDLRIKREQILKGIQSSSRSMEKS